MIFIKSLNLTCKVKIALVSVIILLTACEKVVKFEPHKDETQIVIEGNIDDEADRYTVRVSESNRFNQENNFTAISGASVQITDEAGTSETLIEIAPGLYQSGHVVAAPGTKYHLEIKDKNEVYTAFSEMPYPVEIDSLDTEEVNEFGETTIAINVWFTDPAEHKNYYLFYLTHKGELLKQVFVFDDYLQNGETIMFQLTKDTEGEDENNPEAAIREGDEVEVMLLTVDKPVYDYFRQLSRLIDNEGMLSTTSNPVSNISNNALGYFSAHTVRRKAIRVQ